ncbi:predicted protein, partial [Nematostella vectensis]
MRAMQTLGVPYTDLEVKTAMDSIAKQAAKIEANLLKNKDIKKTFDDLKATKVFAGMEFFIDSGDKPAFIKYPMVSLFLGVFLFLLIAIEIVISAVDKVTYQLLSEEQKKKLEEAQSLSFTESKWYKSLTRSKAIEEEADVMLDHDYDGIKELDNVLPPWWVYLFYGCVVFAVIYLVRFHVVGDYTQEQEYEMSLVEAQKEHEEYLKANPIQ